MLKVAMLLSLSTLLVSAEIVSRTQVIMGTMATISLESSQKYKIQEGFTFLKNIESSLSSYDHNAKVYKLNLSKKVDGDKYLFEILNKSRYFYHLTEGYFDITIGSVTKDLYGFGDRENIPNLKQLQLAQIDINGIHIDHETITLDNGLKLDFGGIGKGYGIDKLSTYYQKQNISKGRVAISGDIRCFTPCTFEIQSPFEKAKSLLKYKAKISNLSISTSGTYERYIKFQKYHHLINPKTKKQGRAFVSVTILTKADNTKADAIATAVSVMPEDKAIDFLLLQDVGFILVQIDKTIISANLEPFVVSK